MTSTCTMVVSSFCLGHLTVLSYCGNHSVYPQVVQMLLKLLEDKNGEVQNLAVKW